MCTKKVRGFMFIKCAAFLVLIQPVKATHEILDVTKSMSISHNGEVEISPSSVVRKVPTTAAMPAEITQLAASAGKGKIVRRRAVFEHDAQAMGPSKGILEEFEHETPASGKGSIVRRATGSGGSPFEQDALAFSSTVLTSSPTSSATSATQADRYREECGSSGCSDDGAAVCSSCGTHSGQEMFCCNKGLNYTFGHNCYNGNFANGSGQHQCLTMTPMPPCQGDHKSWDGGYGDCTTYANTSGSNFLHCTTDLDQRTGKLANGVCPECAACLADLCEDDNVAVGVTATSPDGYAPSGAGGEADKVVDGDPSTFWGEVKGQQGPYVVELSNPQGGPLIFAGYSLQVFVTDSPKTWTLLCDGSNIDEQSSFASTNDIFHKCMGSTFSCAKLRLSITGWYGDLPTIREFRLHSKQAACSVTDGSAASSKYPCICGVVSCSTDQPCTSASNQCQQPPTPAPPPTPPEAMDTKFGDPDSNVCPSGFTFITEASKCKSAATAHKLIYKWTFSHASAPRGCCLDGTTGDVYLNTHSTGVQLPTGRLLCQQAPTSSPTDAPTSAPTSTPTSVPTSLPTTVAPTTVAPTTSSPTPAATTEAVQDSDIPKVPELPKMPKLPWSAAVHRSSYVGVVLAAAVSFAAAISESGIGEA